MKKYIVLHNVRSAHNVGSVFRTAECAGVESVFLCGYTPTPIDRFGRIQPEIEKTSLKATQLLSWQHHDDIFAVIQMLKNKRIEVVAVEQHRQAKEFHSMKLENDVAFMFGNEREGIPERVLKEADQIVEIAMHGKKESLNVSVAAGVILFNIQ